MSNEKLEVCPMCGGDAVVFEHRNDYAAACGVLGCGIRTPWHGTKKEALAAWNRRTPAEGGPDVS